MKNTLLLLALGGLLATSTASQAQQRIPLDSAAVNRLGIVFQKVAAPDNGTGARFAATVIASPQAVSDLHALHDGVLQGWQVQSGQHVQAGQLLAVLRSDDVAELQRQWVEAVAQAELTAKALERDRALQADGIIAAQRLQQTERDAQAAAIQLRALDARMELSGHGAAERNALRNGKEVPGRYLIKAPVTGTVTHLRHVAGDVVPAGEAVVSVAGDNLWVTAEIPARLASRLQSGQSLPLADHNATLTVRQIDQAVDLATQTLGLLAEFTAGTGLLPGQVVSVILPPPPGGVLVPAEAVVRNGNDRVVFVRSADGVEGRVLTLQPAGTDYLATEGLKPGDQVAVRGASVLKGITLGLGGE